MRPCEDWCIRAGYHYGPCVAPEYAVADLINARVTGEPLPPDAEAQADALIAALRPVAASLAALLRLLPAEILQQELGT